MKQTLLLSALCIFSSFIFVNGDVASDWIMFYRSIFNQYNKYSFPRVKQSHTVDVTLSYYLNGINNFDEVAGELKTVGFLKVEWKNELARWADQPGGMSAAITDTMIPISDLWFPPLALVNSVNSLAVLGSSEDLVAVQNTGENVWRPAVILSSSCSTNPLYFPFDTQTCNLTFRAWDHIQSEITLKATDTKVRLDFFSPSEQWELRDTEIISWEREDISYLTFSLKLRRIPLWFVINMAAPIGLLGLLTTFVFLLPIEEGRVGYALGSFLTFSVYLSYIIDSLPRTSDPMSYLTIYIVIQVIMSGSVSCISVFTVKLYMKDEEARIPNYMALCIGFICCKFCSKDEEIEKEKTAAELEEKENDNLGFSPDEENENQQNQESSPQPEELPTSSKFGVPNIKWKPMDADGAEICPDEDRIAFLNVEVPRVGWKMVAKTIDIIFFLGTIAAHTVLAFFFLLPIVIQY